MLTQSDDSGTGRMPLRLYSANLEFHIPYLQQLAREASAGLPEAVDRFTRGHQKFVDRAFSDIVLAPPTLEDAQEVSAHEHGFASWQDMADQCHAITSGEADEPAIDFFRAVEGNETDTVADCLGRHPDLVNAVASTGKAPLHKSTTREMVQLLLGHGADASMKH
jgi:hypothetical protein